MKNPPESQSLFTVGLIFSPIADKYNTGIRFFNRFGFNLAALIYNTDGGIFLLSKKSLTQTMFSCILKNYFLIKINIRMVEITMNKINDCALPNCFFKACAEGDLETVKDLLPIVNVNQLLPDGFADDDIHHPAETPHLKVSPFLRAAQNEQGDVLKLLLRHGVDLTKVVTFSAHGMEPFCFSMDDVLRASRAHAAGDKAHPVLKKYVLSLDMIEYVDHLIHGKPSQIATHKVSKERPTDIQNQRED